MPDLISKIPIGFNLEGYNFINSTQANTAPSAYAGVDADWSGAGLVDRRWIADEKLKQVQFEGTFFQSVPCIYLNEEGRKECLILSDGTGNIDGVGKLGGGAWGGSIYADCNPSNTAQLNAWGDLNKTYHGGSNDNFVCGVGICPRTVVDYLNHFYNLGIGIDKAKALCSKHILCVEVLYNTGPNEGKAFRLKVVDSSGNNGYKGSPNVTGGWTYTYDVLDTMAAVLLTPGFEDVVTWQNTKYGLLNSDQLYFPWKSQKYDYLNGQIPGYSPSQLIQLGLQDSPKRVSLLSAIKWKSHYTAGPGKHAVSRGRFFVDPKDKDKAKAVIPNLPDDFFQTNYAEGGTGYFGVGIDLSEVGAAPEKIRIMAEQCSGVIANAYTNKNPFYYGNGKFISAAQDSSFKWQSENHCIDCDSFVDWVLTEVGVKRGPAGSISNGHAASEWSPDIINSCIMPGYIAIDLGTDITKAIPGDILIWGKNNSHHAAIFAGLDGGAMTEYGMGLPKYTGRGSPPEPEFVKQPHRGMGTSTLSYIIRIKSTQA